MKELLIKYRMERAEESLAEAELLYNEGKSYRGAVNRAYYAMFYSVLALLAKQGKGTSKHSGAMALFDLNFIKPGIFPKEMGKALHRIFDLRQMGDYRDLFQIDQKKAESALKTSREFVEKVKEYLKL